MKFEIKEPPRRFHVGVDRSITIQDMGSIALDHDEQVTFTTPAGAETDFVRKSWGFYGAGSLNSRLINHKLKAALTLNEQGCFYILYVEDGMETEFYEYLEIEKNTLVCWLDDKNLKKIHQSFASG